jgi:hypothetical protein
LLSFDQASFAAGNRVVVAVGIVPPAGAVDNGVCR